MNLSEVSHAIFIITTLASIPIISSNLTFSDDYKPALALSLNTSDEKAIKNSFYSVKRELSGEKTIYTYSTPYGEVVISFSPEKFESEMKKINKIVRIEETPFYKFSELKKADRRFFINVTPSFAESKLETPYGYVRVISRYGENSTEVKASIPEEEILDLFRQTEAELKQELELLQNYTEDVFGLRKVEITYLHCSGGNETEYVEITNRRMITVNLKGFVLKDTEGETHRFDDLVLQPGESVRLYRNVTGITWGNDDTAILLNPEGEIISQRECDS